MDLSDLLNILFWKYSNDRNWESKDIQWICLRFYNGHLYFKLQAKNRTPITDKVWDLSKDLDIDFHGIIIEDILTQVKRKCCLYLGQSFWENIKSYDPIFNDHDLIVTFKRNPYDTWEFEQEINLTQNVHTSAIDEYDSL